MPYIVRVERGTLNRGIYDIAVLFDPAAPAWTATAPQPQWNGKVVVQLRRLDRPAAPAVPHRAELGRRHRALSRGFMVVDNSLTDSLYNSNRTLAAETTLMMKEHIVDNYGEIEFTMGNGCSGGSIGQNTVSSIYPGLLDGIQPSCDYPDSITTGIEVTDCVLLVNVYVKPEWQALMAGLTQAQINAKKAAINGHRDQLGCHGWNNAFGFNNKPGNYVRTLVADATGTIVTDPSGPRNNCLLPAALVYDPATNPTGTRCGDPDLAAAIWGTTANTAAGVAAGNVRALSTSDNVGVQYGLKALLAGAITAEEFVDAEREDRRRRRRFERDCGPLGRRRGRARHRLSQRHRLERQEPRQGRDHRFARLRRRARARPTSTTTGAASRSARASTRRPATTTTR